jgi:hypothetical protein
MEMKTRSRRRKARLNFVCSVVPRLIGLSSSRRRRGGPGPE